MEVDTGVVTLSGNPMLDWSLSPVDPQECRKTLDLDKEKRSSSQSNTEQSLQEREDINQEWLATLLKQEPSLLYDPSMKTVYCKVCRSKYGIENREQTWSIGFVVQGSLVARFRQHKNKVVHKKALDHFMNNLFN